MNYLQKQNTDLSQVAKYYGEVNTNHGYGLVYEKIQDYDGQDTKSLRYYIWKQLIPRAIQIQLIHELKRYLSKNSILFVDTSLTNIFCKKIDADNYKLIIIDGLGAKRMGIKFWLYLHCKIYTKYKIFRQWQKFMQMYKKDTDKIDAGITHIRRF